MDARRALERRWRDETDAHWALAGAESRIRETAAEGVRVSDCLDFLDAYTRITHHEALAHGRGVEQAAAVLTAWEAFIRVMRAESR